MIYNLLQDTLPKEYGITGRSNISLSAYSVTGLFQKGDPKACTACKAKFANRSECDEVVMKIDAGKHNLIVVDYESYVNQFNGRKIAEGGRCDFIICDNSYVNKIMFCDLGCYSDTYLENKIAKVRQQTKDSIARLLNKTSGLNFLNGFCEKQLVFFRRDSAIKQDAVVPQRGNVLQNMQAFIASPSTKSNYIEANVIANGMPVKFIIINYPNTYNW